MTDWHELVIEGSEKVLRAFVAGFVAGRGERVGGVFGSDLKLESESLGERLRALFVAGSHHVFLAPAALAVPLAGELVARGAEIGLRLEHRRTVEGVSFRFRVEAFSPELADGIRDGLVRALPPDVRVEDLSEHEETHPEARGPEPFAPLHRYIYRGSGRITGAFEPVIQVWQQNRERDFVEIDPLHIDGKILS